MGKYDGHWYVAKTTPRRHDGYQEVLIVVDDEQGNTHQIATMHCWDSEEQANRIVEAVNAAARRELREAA